MEGGAVLLDLAPAPPPPRQSSFSILESGKCDTVVDFGLNSWGGRNFAGNLPGSQNGLGMEGGKCDTVVDFGLGGWDGAIFRLAPWVTERPRYGGRKV